MPTAVKKKVENSAQKAWWRIALSSVQPSSTKSASAFLTTCGEPRGEQPPRQQRQRHQQAQRDDAEDLVGAAPADMIDQDLRRRQQDQHAGARRGIDHRHRGRQPRAEPAAEQDRIRHVADEGDADADAEPDAQLELPERLRMRGDQERAAEQQQPERIDRARAGAVEQPADQRRRQSAREPGQRIDRDHLRAVPAEILRDRLEENRKALAEAAAEHRQRKAQRQHVERDARRLRRLRRTFSRWRL